MIYGIPFFGEDNNSINEKILNTKTEQLHLDTMYEFLKNLKTQL